MFNLIIQSAIYSGSKVKKFPSALAAVSRFPAMTIIFACSACAAAVRSGCSCQERFAATVIVCIHSCRALFSLTSTMKPWSSSRLWTENRFRPVQPRIPPFADGRLRSGTLLRILRCCFMPPIRQSAPCSANPSWRTYENLAAVG